MPKFRVNIAPGVSHVIEAKNEDEARKKTRAEIAKGAVSPFYDELFFDYETGVDPRKIKPKEGKPLRQRLGRAEVSKDPDDPYKEQNKVLGDIMARVRATTDPYTQEGVAQNIVGDSGFIRNTKGQLALTPDGLRLLGLPVKTARLQDGTVIEQNTIIDENNFNMMTGDAADMSGIAGPVLTTIAAFLPQTKIIQGFTSLLGGRSRLARTFVAGVASSAGKAGEEYLDAIEGFQLQDADEIEGMLKSEFVIGSVGQGVFGEIPGAIFKAALGKTAPLENQRIGFVASRNLSWADVKKLDEQAGKPLTNDQILKAAKSGEVRRFDYKLSKGFLPSRGVYGQKLPANYQAIVEQVLGNKRRRVPNTAYLRAALNDILKNIKGEKEALNQSLSLSSKKGLDAQVDKALQNLRLQEQKVTESLRKLLDDVGEDILEVGDYGNIPANKVFGEELKDTVAKAQGAAMGQSGELYHAVDKKLVNFRYYKTDADGNFVRDVDNNLIPEDRKFNINRRGEPELAVDENRNPILRTELEINKAKVINKVINNVVLKHLQRAKRMVELDKPKKKGTMQRLTDPAADIPNNIRKQLEDNLDEAIELAKNGQYDLRMIRNDANYIRRFLFEIAKKSDERKLVENVMRVYDDYGIGRKGKQNTNSILTELGEDLDKTVETALAGKQLRLDKNEKLLINQAMKDLRSANKNHAERMQPFDNAIMQGLVIKAGKGVINAEEVYSKALIAGTKEDLDNIFKGLREYDDYVKVDKYYQKTDADGNIIPNYYEAKLKADLKNRLFADALYEATKDELTDVNFTQFAREILKFERLHGKEKFDSLFTDPVSRISTGGTVRATINQLNQIGFNPKPKDLRNLINDITARNAARGLNPSEQGKVFVEQLKRLADATEKRMKFERTKAIADLPEKTIEETVNTIFRPGSATVINNLRETVDETVFNDIQKASMQKLLARSIDMNGEGNITDLFKAQNLKTSLDSYGDETLDAMFGSETRRGLRAFQEQIDVLTGGEPGRGGAAGGLIAAGLSAAIVFAPLANIPTVAALIIARELISFPFFVRLMSRSDQGSIGQALQIFNTTLRQFGLRMLDGEIVPISSGISNLLEGGFDKGATAIGITDDEIQGASLEGQSSYQELRDKVLKPFITQPNLPQVAPVQTPQSTTDPLSQERLDFAEQVAGRPVL